MRYVSQFLLGWAAVILIGTSHGAKTDISASNGHQSAVMLSDPQLAGVFVSQDGKQAASFYAHKDQGVAACFYGKMGTDENGAIRPPDLAIFANESEAGFQIVDANGRVHFVPATALLKLEAK